MTSIGYILLAVIGYLGLKAFGGSAKTIPSFPGNAASPIDPATGAKIINTTGLMPAVNQRIPATDIGAGKKWCPYPFKLYKDLADGKFYCYNENAPIATSSTSPDQTLTLANQYQQISVNADAPVPIDTSSYVGASTLTSPIDPSDPAYLAMIQGNVLQLAPPATSQQVQTGSGLDVPAGIPDINFLSNRFVI